MVDHHRLVVLLLQLLLLLQLMLLLAFSLLLLLQLLHYIRRLVKPVVAADCRRRQGCHSLGLDGQVVGGRSQG